MIFAMTVDIAGIRTLGNIKSHIVIVCDKCIYHIKIKRTTLLRYGFEGRVLVKLHAHGTF